MHVPIVTFLFLNLNQEYFLFNAPYGACPTCKGLGITKHISVDLLIPDKDKSILGGAIQNH